MVEVTGPFRLEQAALLAEREPTFEEWQTAGAALRHMSQSLNWFIGDWLLLGERLFPDRYAQAVDATGYSYQTVANCRWVCGRIEPERRRPELAFHHHTLVAALEPPEQEKLLGDAVRLGQSCRELRECVVARRRLGRGAAVTVDADVDADAPPDTVPVTVRRGSVADARNGLAANSVALILADFPADEKSQSDYEQLARLAGKLLRPGGSLCVYAPQYAVGAAWAALQSHLAPCWLLSVRTPATVWSGKQVRQTWRPILWFTKGGRGVDAVLDDAPEGDADEYLITNLSVPGEVVLDPWCGSGRHLDAVVRLGRTAVGYDPSEVNVRAALLQLEG